MRTPNALCPLLAAAVILAPWSDHSVLRAQDEPSALVFKTTVDVGRLNYLRKEERAGLAANGFVICIRAAGTRPGASATGPCARRPSTPTAR